MIFIGNRRILFSETLLCPAEERINLNIPVPGEDEPWKIEIFFSHTEVSDVRNKKEKVKPAIHWTVEKEVWLINFENWNSPLGATLSTPSEIAISTNGYSLTLLAEVAKLTNLYRANIQIMTEESDNE